MVCPGSFMVNVGRRNTRVWGSSRCLGNRCLGSSFCLKIDIHIHCNARVSSPTCQSTYGVHLRSSISGLDCLELRHIALGMICMSIWATNITASASKSVKPMKSHWMKTGWQYSNPCNRTDLLQVILFISRQAARTMDGPRKSGRWRVYL